MSLAETLTQRWHDPARRPWLARPLTWLYRWLVAVRAWLYRHRWLQSERLPVPVVVVGNITVGGVGKTPLVMALVAHMQEHGWQPGVVSRGYGRSQDTPTLLPEAPEPGRHGDEPSLIRRRTGAPVAVGRDRPVAARLLLGEGCDVIIADDGLQHYRLQRDVEICVIDGQRRLGNGLMLPCGPLREPPSRLRRVDFVIANGGEPGPGEIPMTLAGARARHLHDAERERPLDDFSGQRVHAVAGIGNPARFFAGLRARGIEVLEHPFPDHHVCTRADLAFDDNLPVLMTEKDAVKCASIAPGDSWSVPVTAQLPRTFLDALRCRLESSDSRIVSKRDGAVERPPQAGSPEA